MIDDVVAEVLRAVARAVMTVSAIVSGGHQATRLSRGMLL